MNESSPYFMHVRVEKIEDPATLERSHRIWINGVKLQMRFNVEVNQDWSAGLTQQFGFDLETEMKMCIAQELLSEKFIRLSRDDANIAANFIMNVMKSTNGYATITTPDPVIHKAHIQNHTIGELNVVHHALRPLHHHNGDKLLRD